jgi:NAD(P)H dehydrogenase (quinone)
VVTADWYDSASLASAMEGVDKVLVVTPDFLTDENIVTPNIIAAVRQAGAVAQVVRLIALPEGLTAEKLGPEFLATRCGANLSVIAKPLLDASGLPITYINVPCWIMFNLPWFLAGEVKARRRLAMPAQTDAPRLWISEQDIAACIALILSGDAAAHIGKEYVLTGTERLDFVQIAGLLSEELGEDVRYVDDGEALRTIMGDKFDKLMTYFQHETRDYGQVAVAGTVQRLLGRPQVALRDYLRVNREYFL